MYTKLVFNFAYKEKTPICNTQVNEIVKNSPQNWAVSDNSICTWSSSAVVSVPFRTDQLQSP